MSNIKQKMYSEMQNGIALPEIEKTVHVGFVLT